MPRRRGSWRRRESSGRSGFVPKTRPVRRPATECAGRRGRSRRSRGRSDRSCSARRRPPMSGSLIHGELRCLRQPSGAPRVGTLSAFRSSQRSSSRTATSFRRPRRRLSPPARCTPPQKSHDTPHAAQASSTFEPSRSWASERARRCHPTGHNSPDSAGPDRTETALQSQIRPEREDTAARCSTSSRPRPGSRGRRRRGSSSWRGPRGPRRRLRRRCPRPRRRGGRRGARRPRGR